MTDTFTEAGKLWPKVIRYRKLIAALVTTSGPLSFYLLGGPHSAEEIAQAVYAWALVNLGVYGVTND